MASPNKKKTKILLLCGSKSAEYEVSLKSAKNIFKAIDKDRYEVVVVCIDKHKSWNLIFIPPNFFTNDNLELDKLKYKKIEPQQILHEVDIVFPVLHGTYGEDGTIQGLLRLYDIPFIGSGILGSSMCMDKDVAKRLLRDAGLPTSKFQVAEKISRNTLKFTTIANQLGSPFIIKPANMGSSIGVSLVHNKTQFNLALDKAFAYDNKILIEEYIIGKEIECSLLGNEYPQASLPGEVFPSNGIYSYEDKYSASDNIKFEVPAKLSQQLTCKIQKLAILAFKTLCCEGMARADFFIRNNSEIFINELNTIPGFTNYSLYPVLWERSGMSRPKLMDQLIQLAFERHKHNRELITARQSH